jgi:hypothetical protein
MINKLQQEFDPMPETGIRAERERERRRDTFRNEVFHETNEKSIARN